MSILGNLEDFSLPEVLQLLARGRHTGTLNLTGPDTSARIQIHEGRVLSGSSPRSPKLGHSLVRSGRITIAQLKEVLEAQKAATVSTSVGVLLHHMQLVTSEHLEIEILKQTLDVIREVTSWPRGTFFFQKQRSACPAAALSVTAGFTVDYLLLEFMRCRDERGEPRRPAAARRQATPAS